MYYFIVHVKCCTQSEVAIVRDISVLIVINTFMRNYYLKIPVWFSAVCAALNLYGRDSVKFNECIVQELVLYVCTVTVGLLYRTVVTKKKING